MTEMLTMNILSRICMIAENGNTETRGKMKVDNAVVDVITYMSRRR